MYRGNNSDRLWIIDGMILSAFGERSLFGATTGLSRRRCVALLLPAIAVYGVALCLPAVRIQPLGWSADRSFDPGYAIAFWTEAIVVETAFEAGRTMAKSAFGAPFPRGAIDLTNSWGILAGVTANHLFGLACLVTLLRRLRLAAALAGMAALLAAGCRLPEQVTEWNNGWVVGPGYFVWCAAPVVLVVATRRAARRTTMAGGMNDVTH